HNIVHTFSVDSLLIGSLRLRVAPEVWHKRRCCAAQCVDKFFTQFFNISTAFCDYAEILRLTQHWHINHWLK
ncbi:MAG: hypothetical protein K2H61_05660, partial [Muribaculaceae bacterium]|nr:hypothetical protein [Muribaculaceae bacterium]